MASARNEDRTVLEAETIFLLMKKGFPISRNVRAQWLLEHLDSVISIQCPNIKTKEKPELEVVSVLPKDKPVAWSIDTSHLFLYKVVSATSIVFLAHKYRMVFSLDLSPSLATVDVQSGEIVIDEVYLAMKRCLEGITRPFTIPGSRRMMQPEIYVTVIAHTPFFTSPAQQVLVQGWLVTADNVKSLTQYIEKQLYLLEERVAVVTAIANQQLENLKAESERLVGRLFEESSNCLNKNNCNISIVSPEASFVNMLRYGMLALTLLPEHSCAHMIIVTDGIVGIKNAHTLDSIIQQLRATTVACSFLRVGSAYNPHCADGLVPYQDLLYFIAAATLGSYMSFNSYVIPVHGTDMNLYHNRFLCWQLYRDISNNDTSDRHCWRTENNCFHEHKSGQLLKKKQIDDKVTCTLSSLLCCRLREGYLIKRANIRDDILEINFELLWKTNVFLEYLVTCPWPSKSLSLSNVIQYTITIEAPYDFLHDITCLSKKPLNSHYRQGVISRFWTALTSLTESDNMLAHFSWFPGSGWTWYSVPDTIRSGMPVFYLSSYPSPSTVQLSDAACPQFGQIWQPVVSLDPLQWARWMHTQRITLILVYDRPLPRHLHQANQSGRFQCVQSRQAAAVLYAMLKNWATFVLVENHTYVKFIYEEAEKPPVSFSLIRINCKALCVVLNIAFAGGTEGVVRHNVVVDLVDRLSKLTLPNRPTEQREIPCCTIIHKSLERILVRYERIPNNLSMVVFPDGTQPTCTRTALGLLGGSLTTTLSRYLYHNRWLWHVKRPFVQTIPGITLSRLNITAIARILSTITKIRLGEGFDFAYSAAGITNMVLEVQMQGFGNDENSYPCIIQYVLFPPHVVPNATLERDSGTEDDTEEGITEAEVWTEDSEGYSDFQIVTEVWVEPQCGYVQVPMQSTAMYMHSLQYHQLPDAIARIDEECINALLTLEYLSLLCQVTPMEKDTEIVFGQAHQGVKYHGVVGTSTDRISECPNLTEPFEATPIIDERIHPMYFSFDTLSILPKCQQAELLFSMFADDPVNINEDKDNANRILMDNFLEHMKQLHNKELLLTSAESQRFTKMLFSRPRENIPPLPFFAQEKNCKDDISDIYPRWKCFVKGISTTHVIITILPATEKDVRLIMYTGDNCTSNNSEKNCDSDIFDLDMNEKISSPTLCTENIPDFVTAERRESKISSQSTTANSTSKANVDHNFDNADNEGSLVIPVYVYDCSLALLIDALVGQLQTPQNKDIYQDHTFKIGEQISEDFVSLKSESNTKPSSPEPKSEDSDNISSDQRSLMEHCKLLCLAHCHSYVVAVYKSLALQQSLSYEDMEAAVAQCEENLIEINITNYLRSVCRHLSMLPEGDLLNQLKISACNDIKPLHSLIKNKFKKIMAVAFRPVPAHPEFYYCLPSWMSEKVEMVSQRTDSDDDLDEFTCHSEMPAPKTDNSSNQVSQTVNITWPVTNVHNNERLSRSNSKDSLISDFDEENTWNTKDQPLFLHLSCSIRFRSELSSIPVKLMPTCFTEIVQRINDNKEKNLAELSLDDLKVTLDIICLNLPKEVLEVSLERYPALRTTSYCSASTFGSVPSGSSPSANAKTESMQERMPQQSQHHAVINLKDEIEWLLRDETATALLDHSSPNADTLKFIAQHVSESTGRSSCSMDKVPLHFVFPSESSLPKFLKELKNLEIDKYCICQEADLFYFVKKPEIIASDTEPDTLHVEEQSLKDDESVENTEQEEISATTIQINGQDAGDAQGYYSEISSIAEGKHGTDDGYEGDSSNSEDDYQWLIELDKRRDSLPNFWLIINVESSHVNVYFHCRFLELSSPEVDCYLQIQKMLVVQIKAICRRVNQYLLLQHLHDTRVCDLLLEPESTEDHNAWKETGNEFGNLFQNHSFSTPNVTPGMFRCPVIWEEPFNLHPRLKTGPGRSGLSRGIKALHGVLNRLSVNNRNNMFVYQENNKNVFYLRLHEQTNDVKPLQNKLSESDEKLVVSRSNSVASLSQAKGIGLANDHVTANDTRPRVRSFGEKESDILNRTGDSIILMVHGISEAGPEVKRDLVQVLQNRLDDAVLEVLSVMLARNPMCKLTPADVHFIQKPYKSPECIVQLSVQPHCLPYMDALGYYLRQNILQFLYMPKYTDLGAHYHFQDYTPLDGTRKRVSESDIFLYNQSHSSGSKGIACIALAITDGKGEFSACMNNFNDESSFPKLLVVENFENIVSTKIYDHKSDAKSNAQIEFRIWKQGRVNLESLIQKLSSAVKHGTWDLVTEYNLLATPLTESMTPSPLESISEITENKEIQTPVKIPQSQIPDNFTIDQYELGEKGKLREIYHTTLARWFQFALDMNVPAIKKHEVIIHHRHAIPMIVRELQNLIRNQDPDTSSKVFVLHDRQPFLNQFVISHKPGSVFKSSDSISNPDHLLTENRENINTPVYVPHEFNKDEQTTHIKCILVARNFHQWKASLSKEIDPELLAPKDQKQLQKFNPLISESNFVPRQRILLAEILSDYIIIYMYNWSKEKSEKLIKQTTNLGTWLSSRSSLFTNIIMQKLGIFHHKLNQEPQQREQGSQYYQINDMESLAKFPSQSNVDKDWTRSSNRTQSKNNAFSWIQMVGQAMRDAKPSASHSHNTTDAIVKAAYDLQDLRHREKKIKEDLEKLYAMWQSRTPNIPISLNALNTFKQNSRLIHFCHTPLLFLPAWRLQSAATRDHSLTPQSSHFGINDNVHEQSPQAAQLKQEATNAIMTKWHQELCKSMLSEYKQYLQILGFNPIQVESLHKTNEEHVQQQSYYLKKSMLGGILLFEVHLSQPFFIVKLHIIECNRLQTKTSSGMMNQFVLSFVDVCDKIQINMHLHSFTYDFHLRCIHSYIAGTGLWSLHQGYHLAHFMDDFIKYYSKAPNYARNLIYSDVITIRDIVIPARILYSYLLSHEKVYGMRVFVMSGELQESHDNEYVLIKLQSTPSVSYCDVHDTKCTDDFDVALIVSRVEQLPQIEKSEITLKYYLMLTSKRELYPKREVENNKLGKFRTVYSVGKPTTSSCTESTVECSSVSPTSSFVRGHSKSEVLSTDQQEKSLDSLCDVTCKDVDIKTINCNTDNNSAPTPPPVPNSPLTQNSNIPSVVSNASSSPHLVQIRQESVNYLGYYSSHEQLMQQMIMAQAKDARQHITNMVERGALQCRTHLLWDKLLENKTSMTYTEFKELCSLAHIEPLANLDPRLGPLVNQPVSWYQALSKVLQNKYQEHHKQFITSDGNITHHLILHPTLLQAFMMLTIDMHTSRGDLYAVYRKATEINMSMNMDDIYTLIEGFVNACCFHLWMGLCSQ